jgi:hypothetical protein
VFKSVDAGHGWLIFALPPPEAAFHPSEGSVHELYFMCDDLKAEITSLAKKGVTCSQVQEARWGSITKIRLPGGGDVGLYQPKHPTAFPCPIFPPPRNFVRLFDQGSGRWSMKYRIAIWAAAGFLVASGWAVYFLVRNKDLPIEPIVSTLVRLTCPVAIIGRHYPVTIYLALAANVATYALVGIVVEIFRRQLKHSR